MNENRRETGSADRGGHIRALALLGAASAIFLFALILCICLIVQSADVAQPPTRPVGPLEYEVQMPVPTTPITTTTDPEGGEETVTIELVAPVSGNDSNRINILLMGVEEEKNDTLIIAGVDTAARTVSFLSIPRDTYISGDYDLPKAKMVYSAFDEDRRIAAVKEAVKDMFGFWVDYYFVLDEVSLSTMVSFADGVEYDVPSNPNYHSLSSGQQTVTAEEAFELFRFKKSWTDVETDPPRVQRYFLQALFAELLEDEKSIAENCLALAEVAKTDLSAGQMAYLAYLLLEFDFENAFSRALPGGEVKIEGVSYYEVNAQKAVEMLNEHFNPLQKDLTVYNVHFRQEQGASGEGEYNGYAPYPTTTTKNKTTTEEEEPTESEEDPAPEDPTESTDANDTEETETSEKEPEVTESGSDAE